MARVGESVSASSSLLGIFIWMEQGKYHTEGQGTPSPSCHGGAAGLAHPRSCSGKQAARQSCASCPSAVGMADTVPGPGRQAGLSRGTSRRI